MLSKIGSMIAVAAIITVATYTGGSMWANGKLTEVQENIATMSPQELDQAAGSLVTVASVQEFVPICDANELQAAWTEVLGRRVETGLVKKGVGISGDVLEKLAKNTSRHEIQYTHLKKDNDRSYTLEFALNGKPVMANVAGKPVIGKNAAGKPVAHLIRIDTTGQWVSDSSKAAPSDKTILADHPNKLSAEQITSLTGKTAPNPLS